MEKIGSIEFTAALVKHGSWGNRDLGNYPSTMELYMDGMTGFIEWDIPSLGEFECIGLWFDDDRNLTDYDGIMALPRQAVSLLRAYGFHVSDEFI